MSIDAVLLDLDGTLVDTAPDLVGVLNLLLREQGHRPLPYAVARNEVSNGSTGLLRRAYGDALDVETFAALRDRFLSIYAERVCINSRLFIDLDSLFDVESGSLLPWGIVTNKPQRLTEALLEALGIAGRPACVVSGDQLSERKPHPAPLEHAARLLGIDPRRCIYVGDAVRDIVAGKAAGMKTVLAAYGYIRPAEDVRLWGADVTVHQPRQLRSALLGLRGQASEQRSQ